MKSKIYTCALLIVLLMALIASPVYATEVTEATEATQEAAQIASGVCGENITWVLTDDGVITISGTGDMPTFGSINPWYDYWSQITSVVIGEGITSVGPSAFRDFAQIVSVTLPESVTTIGNYAFYNCTALQSVQFPKEMETIGDYAFYNCAVLQSVQFPKKMESIGEYAFYCCHQLKELHVPQGIRQIAPYAFYNCYSLQTITFPDTLSSIETYAFYNIEPSNITFPASITSIADDAFHSSYIPTVTLESLEGWIRIFTEEDPTISNNPVKMAQEVYCDGQKLSKVVIPEGITELYGAFYRCEWLEEVVLPEGLRIIGNNAFDGCANLKTINIPASVTSIGEYAFACNLTRVDIASVEAWCKLFETDGAVLSTPIQRSTAVYLDGEPVTSVIIPEGIRSLYGTFTNWGNLTQVQLPKSLEVIGASAFAGCYGLKNIQIPDGVKSIENDAFLNCSNLKDIVIPTSVTSMGRAFTGCYRLESITIPFVGFSSKTASSLYQYPFGCIFGGASYTSSTAVTQSYYGSSTSSASTVRYYIPNSLKSVTVLGGEVLYGAFSNCTGLKEVRLMEGVTGVSQGAFFGAAGLEALTLPFVGGSAKTSSDTYQYPFGHIFGTEIYTGSTGVTQSYYASSTSSTTSTKYYIPNRLKNVTVLGGEILHGAFGNCAGLTQITLADGVKNVGNSAFYGCSGLTQVNIGAGLTGVGESAFYKCTALQRLDISEGLTTIGKKAFWQCTGLETVTLPQSLKTLGDSAFTDCNALKHITIPGNVASIGGAAFSGCDTLQSITICEGVEIIGASAFRSCPKLTSVTIPRSVTQIGSRAFEMCYALQNVTILSDGVDIDQLAFNMCTALKRIHVLGNVKTIGYRAFVDCSVLTEINIPGATVLAESALPAYVKSIVIPATVTQIGNYTLAGMSQVYFEGNAPTFDSKTFNSAKVTAYYPAGNSTWTSSVRGNYGGTVTWIAYTPAEEVASGECGENLRWVLNSNGELTISGTGAMADYEPDTAPWLCDTAVKTLVIESGVASIGSNAFAGCPELTQIRFLGDAPQISETAFTGVAATAAYPFTASGWNREKTASYGGTLTWSTDYAARVGNTWYMDVQTALDAALTGDTVALTGNCEFSELTVNAGITLDMNGWCLTVQDAAAVFGQIGDSTEGIGALLTTGENVVFEGDNVQMPLYDISCGGYRFFTYETCNKGVKCTEGNCARFYFTILFKNSSAYALLKDAASTGLRVAAELTWTGNETPLVFSYENRLLEALAGYVEAGVAPDYACLTLRVTGLDSLNSGDTVSVKPVIAAAGETVSDVAPMTYVIP